MGSFVAGAFLLPLLCLTTSWTVDFLTKGGAANLKVGMVAACGRSINIILLAHIFSAADCDLKPRLAEAYQQLAQGKIDGQSSDDESKHEDLNSLYYAWTSWIKDCW